MHSLLYSKRKLNASTSYSRQKSFPYSLYIKDSP